ncbi:MAG: acetate--CoA ligase family protein, partial [Candidatus Eisenbacteria bacterium]|nr:acetate--CoA ligase family protein [Candidatus Eisenbacteria bacterium]
MDSRQLNFADTVETLKFYEIPILGKIVTTRKGAVAAAFDMGYPVVVKVCTPEIIHKTDVGVVFLDVANAEGVGESFDLVVKNARKAGVKGDVNVLIQTMAPRGFEMLVGAKQDPVFGPVAMVGHGGRFVELWRDTAPGVGVLSRDDVERMLSKTKAGKVLNGFRGPALDRKAVIDLVIKVSRMMDKRPDINELDLNPVIVY